MPGMLEWSMPGMLEWSMPCIWEWSMCEWSIPCIWARAVDAPASVRPMSAAASAGALR